MSTRSSIWVREAHSKIVHIYWELGEREIENGTMIGAPVYISVDRGDSNQEVAVRVPKELAQKLLTILEPNSSLKII